MNKRNNSDDSDNKTQRKIAKLEKKIARYRDKENRRMNAKEQTQKVDQIGSESNAIPNQTQEFDPEVILEQGSDSEVMLNSETMEDNLDPDFLSALGECSSGSPKYGEKIHEEIFNSVKSILINGLKNKENLPEVLIPSNCKLLEAPKLNLELSSILSNPSKTRDKLLQVRQKDVGLAIASICTIINSLAKKEFDKLDIIKRLSNTSQILANIHFQYTEIRKKLISPSLDKNLAESLKENIREEFLYSNLEDSIKSFSAMKRASNIIKPKATLQPKATSSKNYQQAPRRPNPNQAHHVRGSFRGAAHSRYMTQQRPLYKPQDIRQASYRGRAKYP